MNEPFVSIVVLTMNHEKYIEQSLRSCIAQDYQNKEIVLFDNGSIDSTFVLGKALLEKSGVPFKAIRSEINLGICNGLNTMIRDHSNGEYLCFNSGDDWMDPTNVSKKITYLLENKRFRWIYSLGYTYWEKTNKLELIPIGNRKGGLIFNELLLENLIYFQGSIFEKKLIEEIGYFDPETTIEDWDFSLKAIQNNPIAFLEEPLFYYRRHNSNYSSSNSKEYCLDCLKIISRYRSNPNSEKAIKRWTDFYISALYHEPFKLSNLIYMSRYSLASKFNLLTTLSYAKKMFKRRKKNDK